MSEPKAWVYRVTMDGVVVECCCEVYDDGSQLMYGMQSPRLGRRHPSCPIHGSTPQWVHTGSGPGYTPK